MENQEKINPIINIGDNVIDLRQIERIRRLDHNSYVIGFKSSFALQINGENSLTRVKLIELWKAFNNE